MLCVKKIIKKRIDCSHVCFYWKNVYGCHFSRIQVKYDKKKENKCK